MAWKLRKGETERGRRRVRERGRISILPIYSRSARDCDKDSGTYVGTVGHAKDTLLLLPNRQTIGQK